MITRFQQEKNQERIMEPPESPPPPSPPPPPPISWPEYGILTFDWIQQLSFSFDWYSKNRNPSELPTLLPLPIILHLLLSASDILHKEPNCVVVDPVVATDEEPLGGGVKCDVVVVGDVHGQIHDVMRLFSQAGFPSEERFFVFNGDYVDRGAWGLETFLLLLAWKVYLPGRVFLLRGNHESRYCTTVYGFEQEVMAKYGSQGPQVYRKCLRCFEGLPLASLIAGCVYTAHGGLFRATSFPPSKRLRKKKKRGRKLAPIVDTSNIVLGSFEELAKSRRTVLDPPWEGPNLILGDILWSDPSLQFGISPNNERGIGLLWGPDITEEFLKKNHLKLIVRSHEGPDARHKRNDLMDMKDGYTIDHEVESGKLITLFSAPDYPQFQAEGERFKNRGAYIILQSPDYSSPNFHSFEADLPRPHVQAYYKYEEVLDSDEELDFESIPIENSASDTN